MAGPSPYNVFCAYDQPNTAFDTPNTPGSLPNAFGGNCYKTAKDCSNGPNACNTVGECSKDYVTCSNGQVLFFTYIRFYTIIEPKYIKKHNILILVVMP
jgi:hypothetical protein